MRSRQRQRNDHSPLLRLLAVGVAVHELVCGVDVADASAPEPWFLSWRLPAANPSSLSTVITSVCAESFLWGAPAVAWSPKAAVDRYLCSTSPGDCSGISATPPLGVGGPKLASIIDMPKPESRRRAATFCSSRISCFRSSARLCGCSDTNASKRSRMNGPSAAYAHVFSLSDTNFVSRSFTSSGCIVVTSTSHGNSARTSPNISADSFFRSPCRSSDAVRVRSALRAFDRSAAFVDTNRKLVKNSPYITRYPNSFSTPSDSSTGGATSCASPLALVIIARNMFASTMITAHVKRRTNSCASVKRAFCMPTRSMSPTKDMRDTCMSAQRMRPISSTKRPKMRKPASRNPHSTTMKYGIT
mmetsp:Transcript_47727/g.147225  ORF Transcript_47727/g.147225 Transcript_47727/m.147225 type:complete len:359 (+) Transcript_47727:172-1248(+)